MIKCSYTLLNYKASKDKYIRWLLRLGLSRQEVMEVITRKSAALPGLQDRLGTLEKGKWASFVCWKGDPFDLAGYPDAVYVEGDVVYRTGA